MTLPKPFKSSLPPLYSSKHLGKMTSFAGNMLNATTDEEAYLCAMTLASGTVPPMVMKALIELDVLEIIKKDAGHMSPAEIAAQLPTTNPAAVTMLDRMLRLLASYGIFTLRLRTLPDGHVERTYGLAPISKLFANNDDGVSVAPLLLMNQDKVFMESWYHLKDAVLESGVPFNKAHGMTAFEYNGIDPRFNKIFNNAMSSHSTITVKKILEKYKGFEGVSTLVDVAGGIGTTLHTILSKYPSIKAISFDLPHVIKDVPSYPGAEYIEGDMFVSIPKGDAIFLKWICHDWSDDHCLKLLKNCYSALPNHGKVIICDCILPVASESNNASQMIFHMDVVMLAQSIGGKERTEEEFEYLAKSSGFQSYRVACSANEAKIIEFFKNTN